MVTTVGVLAEADGVHIPRLDRNVTSAADAASEVTALAGIPTRRPCVDSRFMTLLSC